MSPIYGRYVCVFGILLLFSIATPAQQEVERKIDANHIIHVYQMKPLPSGGGKWFSPEYIIGPSVAPKGYVLEYTEFGLNGFHPCRATDFSPPNNEGGHPWSGKPNRVGQGAWSECWMEQRTPTSVVWKYRFQGWEKLPDDFRPHDFDERLIKGAAIAVGMPELAKPLKMLSDWAEHVPPIVIHAEPINIYSEGRATFIFRRVSVSEKSPRYTEFVASVHPEAVKADLNKRFKYSP